MASRNHNFRACSLIVGGIPVSGFASDGGINIEYETDVSATSIGVDGEAVTSQMNNDSTLVVFQLQQQSPSNAALLAAYAAQRDALALGIEAPPLAVLVVDQINGDRLIATTGMFERIPAPSKTREASSNEWAIRLPEGRRSLVLAANRVI